METRETLEKMLASIKEQRDELKVQMHLGKAELKDEWEGLERKWEHIESRLDAVDKVASEAAEDVGAAVSVIAGEISEAYQRIKRALK